MKKLSYLLLSVVMLFTSAISAQSLNDVLKDHFEATGQKKLSKVNSMVTYGKINQMGMEIPFTQYAMRPASFRVEGTFQGLSFIQTFNGTEGWTLNPFAGQTEPQPIPADQLKLLKLQADMDGILWNWEEKGSKVTLEGNEDVEGTSCYKIKVITADGDTYTYFIDSDSYMLIRTNSKVTMSGAEVESDTYYSNYMVVNEIAFPGNITNKYNGATGEVIIVEKVELDKELDKALFEKPATN